MPWICWVIATLTSAIVFGLFWYTWSFKKIEIRLIQIRVSFRTCREPRCNDLYWSSLSLQHHSQTKTIWLCHVSKWQPMQCTLQSAVISEGLHLVLEIPRTQSSCCWHGLIERHILKKIWIFFNLAFEPLAHHNTFCHVIYLFIYLYFIYSWQSLIIHYNR